MYLVYILKFSVQDVRRIYVLMRYRKWAMTFLTTLAHKVLPYILLFSHQVHA